MDEQPTTNVINGFVPMVRASGDVAIHDAGALAVVAGGGATMRDAGAGMLIAGGDVTISQAGAGTMMIGGDVEMSDAAVGNMMAGEASVAGSRVAVLLAGSDAMSGRGLPVRW